MEAFDIWSWVLPPVMTVALSALLGSIGWLIQSRHKTRRVDYHLKRVRLIRELQGLQSEVPGDHDWSVLDQEIPKLLRFVEETSTAQAPFTLRARRYKILRPVVLPWPQTWAGWIWSLGYYGYACLFLYLCVRVFLFWPADSPYGITAMLIGKCILVAIGGAGPWMIYRLAADEAFSSEPEPA